MYRIMLAVNGYYYVQTNTGWRWQKIGGFFNTRRGAERFIDDHRGTVNYVPTCRVVAYR